LMDRLMDRGVQCGSSKSIVDLSLAKANRLEQDQDSVDNQLGEVARPRAREQSGHEPARPRCPQLSLPGPESAAEWAAAVATARETLHAGGDDRQAVLDALRRHRGGPGSAPDWAPAQTPQASICTGRCTPGWRNPTWSVSSSLSSTWRGSVSTRLGQRSGTPPSGYWPRCSRGRESRDDRAAGLAVPQACSVRRYCSSP
jgi:hypothetical protein